MLPISDVARLRKEAYLAQQEEGRISDEKNRQEGERKKETLANLLLMKEWINLSKDISEQGQKRFSSEIDKIVNSLESGIKISNLGDIPQPESNKDVLNGILEALNLLQKELSAKDFSPTITTPKVEAPKVIVPKPEVTVNPAKITVEAPNVTVDTKPIAKTIEDIKKAINAIKLPESPKSVDLTPLIQEVKKLQKAVLLSQPIPVDYSVLTNAVQAVEAAIWNKPTPIPTPVTKIDVNPLRGIVKTQAVTVTTAATRLPSTALANRRSIIVYNNGSVTIYIGGSDVTASGSTIGIPVTAGSYSVPLDMGNSMTLYGVVASETASVIVLEVSNDASGSS